MSNTYFRFKQFTIHHDRCAMKVGTDAVLLGAWAALDVPCRTILDIGTGSGILALMAAQRSPSARITAIDIDPSSVQQASENVAESIFRDRVEVIEADVRSFLLTSNALPMDEAPLSSADSLNDSDPRSSADSLNDSAPLSHESGVFDHILCNPPFFEEDTLPPDAQRAVARNASHLNFESLIRHASRLLVDGGKFHVVLPSMVIPRFRFLCGMNGLQPVRLCKVQTTESKTSKRTLLSLCKSTDSLNLCEESLVLMSQGQRSKEYSALAFDFYL